MVSSWRDGYTFVDLFGRTGMPAVRSVAPSAGKTSGGTRVLVTGSGRRGEYWAAFLI